jgi:4'-phosphopantetheinyl transferase EntD
MEQTAAASSELVFFSAKEAIHKALFPTTRIWMDFLDVELRIGSDPSVLTASGVGNAAPGLQDLVIRALHLDNLVITTAFLPAASTRISLWSGQTRRVVVYQSTV